jgi:hypothetical protein
MLSSIVNNIDILFNFLNSSKFFAGFMMIFLNLGGRYVSQEMTDLHERFLSNKIVRRCLIFVLVFYATRDIKISIVITIIVILLITVLLNEKSDYCILSENVKNSVKISMQEYEEALKIIRKYELQNDFSHQQMNSNMNNQQIPHQIPHQQMNSNMNNGNNLTNAVTQFTTQQKLALH